MSTYTCSPVNNNRQSLMPGLARQNLRQITYNLRRGSPEAAAKASEGGVGDSATVPLLLANRQIIRLNSQDDVCVGVSLFENFLLSMQAHVIVGLLFRHTRRRRLEEAAAQ